MNKIEIKNLSFSYHQKSIVEDLKMIVPKGAIFGLLGQNGAGKTTLIKLMLGVLNAGNNTIFYDGLNFNKHRLDIIKQIGAIVETPSLYEHLTCMEQLVYLNHFYKQPLKRVDEILEIVGISDSQNTKIKHCSTGMKQRLAIGIALFHHPTMLILDEPFNGLDPEGIFDLRNLLQTEHQKGTTIFISGHIISELEKICTHIAILNDCKLAYCKDSVEPKLEQVYMNVILQKKNDHENR